MGPVRVWDPVVRLGHWTLAGAFAVAWVTADSESWRLVHVWAGYVMAAVILLRLVWGVVGTRYARFSSFLHRPAAVLAYLKSLPTSRPQHWTGHNPAGGYAIVALLALGLAAAGSGWLVYNEVGGEWMEEGHEALAEALLAVVGLHLAGVAVSSLLHGENLVRAMVTGWKGAAPDGSTRGDHAGSRRRLSRP
ncbi:MAG: cytochrome b/b6 domain-containing protein [Betaproteobacteria bacterium]|nr:cytochrome b/b6 domain-containing protein [Betaproteobacteria bacterium]